MVNPGTISYNQVGQYAVSLDVTNACGTASATEVFDVFDLPVITMPLDDSICLGESIQLVPLVSAGTPNYTYSWTPITGLSDNTILDPMASPSTTTNYILNVSDANNCAATDSILLEVLPLPIVNVIDQSVCQYDTAFLDGTISSGNTPYSYSWTPAGLLSDDQILDPYYVVVSSQIFTLAVTDQFNCSSSAPLSVTMFDLPIVDAGNDTTLCNQPGIVQFEGTPLGGTWTGSNITSNGDFDPTGVGLFENVYTYTDANGCVNSDTMFIDVIDPTNADAGVDFEVCIDTGSVQLTGSPANGTWSGNGITPTGEYTVIADGIFDFTYSFGAGNCLTNDVVSITVNALPIVNAGADFDVCVDEGIQTLTGNPVGGIWSGIAMTSSGDFDPSVAGVGLHTLYYDHTDVNSCDNVDSLVITVNGLPSVDAGNDTTLCNQPGIVQFDGTPLGGTWTGSNITSNGDFNPTGVGLFENIYTYTDANGCVNSDTMFIDVIDPTNADAGVDFEVCIDTGSVQLTGSPANGTWSGNGITPTGEYTVIADGIFDFTYSFGAGNCLTNDVVSITVNALPIVNAGADFDVCVDEGIQTLTGNPVGGIWSGIAMTSSGDFDPSVAGVGLHTVYYDHTDVNSCDNVDSLVITVNGLPTVDAGPDGVLCNQPGAIQFNGTPSGGFWTGLNIDSSGSFVPDSNGIGFFDNIYTYTDPNGCVNSDTMTIEVIDPTNADAGSDFEVCVDTGSVQLTGLPANGVWSGNGINSGGNFIVTIADTFELVYSFGSGNCLTTDTVILIVNDLPIVDAGSDTAFCVDAAAYTFEGNPVGGIWSGPAVTSSGEFDPSVAGIGLHTIYYDYTDTNTCDNLDSLVITVNGLPTVDAGPDGVLCNQPGAIQFNGTPSGGFWTGLNIDSSGSFVPDSNGIGFFDNIYTYTDPNGCVNSDTMTIEVIDPTNADAGSDFEVCVDTGSVQLTGLPANGVWSGNGINSGGNFIVTIADTFELVYSFGSGNCLTTDTVILIVNDLPIVDAGSDTAFCVDAAAYTFEGNPVGGIWSGPAVTSSGEFDPSVAGIGLHTIYYDYTDTNTCDNLDSLVITVNGLPTVDAGPDGVLCNQPGAIQFNGTPSGGFWTGLNIDSSGSFVPDSNGIGFFDNIYTYTDPNGCVNSDTMTIEVIDPTNADAGSDFEVCVDTGSVQLTGSPANGTWSGNGITPTGEYTVIADGIFDFTYSFGAGNCLTNDVVSITVNALPIVNAGADFDVCVDEGTQTLTGNPVGGIWSGPAVTSSGEFDPSVAGIGLHTIYYDYTDTNTCDNVDSLVITVNGLPSVDAGNDTTLCNQPIPINLNGTPGGGLWSGNNVTSLGEFTPNGVGISEIIYTHTDINGCVNTDTLEIAIVDPTNADAGGDFEVCVDTGSVQLTGLPTNGVWSGNGINSGGNFIVTIADTFALVYNFGSGNCLTTDTVILIVNDLPIVDAGSDTAFCVDAAAYTFEGNPVGGIWSGPAVTSSGEFDPSVAGIGLHTIYYDYTDTNTCDNLDSLVITVNGLPSVDAGNDTTLCNQPIPITLIGVPAGGNWSGSNVSINGDFTPSGTPAGVGLFDNIYTYIDPNGCINSDTMTIQVIDPINADAGLDLSMCVDTGAIQLSGLPLSGTWSGAGVSSTGIFTPTIDGTFTLTYSYGAGNCLTTDLMEVIVHPLPIVNAGSDISLCVSNPDINLIASPTGGYWTGNGVIDSITGLFSPDSMGVGSSQVIYSYQNPSTYCWNYDTINILINPLPVPSFVHDSLICVSAGVQFTNTTNGAVAYNWAFSDGGTSQLQDPIYVFNSTGVFTVNLIAQSNFGCLDSVMSSVQVIEPPTALIALVDSGCAPLMVNYTNNSYGDYISFDWDLGNGVQSNDTIPQSQLYQQGFIADSTYYIELNVSNLCGVDSILDSVVVMPQPIAIFGTNVNIACSPAIFDFANNSLGLPDNYYWDFGNGNTSTSSDSVFQHTFYTGANDTTYTIMLVVDNECGSDTAYHTVTVLPNQVNAFFNADTLSGCNPLTVNFTQYSTGALSYNWDLGDGNFSSLYSPAHTYTSAGTYTVSLAINDGCSYDTAFQSITVHPIPTALFTVINDTLCGNQTFSFINQSLGTFSSYWDFGDGNSSTLTDPVHSYSSPGIYDITLSITDLVNGCENSYTNQVVSLVVPVASIAASSANGCIPLFVDFINNSTNAQFYSWNFGDGNTSNNQNPVNTYLNAGNYYITLIAQNTNGCNDTASINIDAYPIPLVDFSITYNDSCILPASVSFTNNSAGAINYNWIFGDGGTAFSTGPTHYYQNDGQYIVQLTAENSYGCVDSISDNVIIDPIPIISFTTSPLFGCVPLIVDFTNTSQNGNFYNWDFGDGNVSTLPNGSNNYTDPGYYLATLTGEDLNGCSASSSVIITVYPEPVAAFTYVNSDPCYPPVSVDFTNTSTGATNYSWDLDLGPVVNLTHPSIVYSLAGNYNIELIATSIHGCVDTAQASIGVYDTPIASFFLANDTICLRDSILLTSQSSYADSLVWDFGNGDQAYGNDTSYYYETPGSYPITLYAYNTIGGCSDALTLNSNFVVLPSPTADFYFEDTYGANPYSGRLEFFNQSTFADSYLWDYEGWGSSTEENPIYYYQYPAEGTYTYTLYAYNDNGCLDSAVQELTVTFDKGLFIPNAMYPSHSVFKVANFMPQGIGLKEFHIMIFDTYGNFIWESNELDDEEGIPLGYWDGTLKGVPLKEDVYVWKVTKAVFKDNSFWKGKEYPEENKTTYTGTITLIR